MINVNALNRTLEQTGAQWRAGSTALAKLSIEQLRRIATSPLPLKRKLSVRGRALPTPATAPQFDQAVDWRMRNGRNCVTPVKGQGGCGSCVAFAVAGLVESMALIEKQATLDLSEADLAFCGSHTNDCTGWSGDAALQDMKTRGAVTEAQLPYFNDFVPNHTSWGGDTPQRVAIPNHDEHAVKIGSYTDIYDVAQRKAYLTSVGPLVCGITCYDEFGAYQSGVFKPTSNAVVVGGHDILVIGYSETDQFWLIKNSWDVSWGENGFGRIAYGACDIDVETATEKTYFTGCSNVSIPDRVRDEIVQGVSATVLTATPGSMRCSAFYSSSDHDRCVVVAGSDGTLSEVVYRPDEPVSRRILLQMDGLLDIAAFYTEDDGYRHVLTLDKSGVIKEIYYQPGGNVSETAITTVPNGTRLSAFYSSDDRMRHALVATSGGAIIEVFYGTGGQGQTQVANIGPVVDICSFYTRDDGYRHAIIATPDGNVTEIFFQPDKPGGQSVISNVANPQSLAGFYSGAEYYSRRVQVRSGDGKVVEIRFDSGDGPIVHAIYDGAPVADIGGFWSADDQLGHCIAVQQAGDVVEMYY
jgi:hypothetical protein